MYTFRTFCRRATACGMAVAMTLGALGCESAQDTPAADGAAEDALMVRVVPDTAAQKVDVMIGNDLFTSYLYTDDLPVLKKPVLFPIRSPRGHAVTRGYPLEPTAGERTDHPHHIGMWFNYGDVNGLDFWNNSDAIDPAKASSYGTIVHREVRSTENGTGEGELAVTAEWVRPDNEPLLREDTRFVFHATPDMRAIDRVTTLTALNERVDFKDNKEGVLGLRLTRALEMPSEKPVELTDAAGNVTKVPVMDNEGVSGAYRNSEGVSGYPDVWGKRARWTALTGVLQGDSVTVVVMDHPQNVGHPTYWHARDYGLFAANPLGQKALSEGKEELNYALDPGQSTTFRHRVAIFSGHPTDAEIENAFNSFANVAM